MTSRRTFALAVAVLLAAGPARAADPVSIRLDWFASAYHAPFFYGIERGIYAEAGIDLSIAEGRGSVQTVQLVARNENQFGFVAVDSLMRAVGVGMPVISVATLMPVMGQAVYVLKSSNIMSLADLKGRTVAVTPGGTNEAMLPGVLATVGLKESDLKKVSVDASAKVRMFLNGNVDAMIATGWAHALFESAGGARGFIYSDFGMKMVGYSLVTNVELTQKNPELVRRFVAATGKAWAEAMAHPDAAVAALAARAKGHDDAAHRSADAVEFAAATAFMGPAVAGAPYGMQSEKDWTATQEALQKYGVVKQTLPISRYMTNAYVTPAEPRP